MAIDRQAPGVTAPPTDVGPVVVDVLLGFPAAPDPWWRDGTIVPALFDTLRAHDLWFGFDRAGRAGAELTPMGRDELGAWSVGWSARTTYRIAADELAATHLDVLLARGLRMMLVVSSADRAAHASALLDDVAAWLVALRRSDIANGVRIRRGHVWPLADYPTPGAPGYVRAWTPGTVFDAIDREAYAGEVAAQYFSDRYATVAEGEAELARLLAAPAPPGTVRVDDGPLVMWKHVADLTDATAVERARVAQHAWITSLVEVAPA